MFFDKLLSKAPFEREVEYLGEKQTVYFRKISAGEKLALTSTQKIVAGADNKAVMEISMWDILHRGQRLVQLSCVEANGTTKVFKTLDDLAKMPAQLVDALIKIAEEVNKDTEETGKEA